MRFYEINSGKIMINDTDIVDVSRKNLRKIFGMVLQDTWLFQGTIKENLSYSKDNATDEEIIAAAKAAKVHDFIETLPKKYACVAVDINKVEQVIYDSGSLVKAMRCSMSVPGVFVPVNDGDRLLVDGGLLNNVPADIARKMGADIVIAVNLVSEYIPHKPPKTIIDSVALSFFIMQKELTNYQLKDYDVLIAPKLTDYKQYIFNEDYSKGLIEMGYLEAKAQIRKIKYRINKFIKNNNKK
jgi:predicted acylesterase/phospholipase RssA